MIQLSSDQRQAFRQGTPVRFYDADLGEEVVLCSAALFGRMEAELREAAEDDKEQESWVKMSTRTLAQRFQ
jgi:hypothetical protein